MKKIIFLGLFFISIGCAAQQNGIFYVTAKSGLSLREGKNLNAKLLVKIPYGTKISVNYPDEIEEITIDGMDAAWAKTTYGGKSGYVVNAYLIPWPPPKATAKTMKQYLPQVSPPIGAPVIVKNGSIEFLEAGGSNMKKQFFKNGAEYHEEIFYEAGNDIYFLPGFTLQQGFVLLRLIPEFEDVFGETDSFPSVDKTIKRGEEDYSIQVIRQGGNPDGLIEKIKVEYADGAYYTFEMFLLGGQLVISFGGGV
jgi:uncharacterized protein YgiM (DUF1202 family)